MAQTKRSMTIFLRFCAQKKKKEQRFLFPSSSRMLWSCGWKRKEETDATHTHIHVFIDKSGQRWIFSSVSFRSPTSLFYVWALFDSVSGAIISFIIANLSKRLEVNNFQNQIFFLFICPFIQSIHNLCAMDFAAIVSCHQKNGSISRSLTFNNNFNDATKS